MRVREALLVLLARGSAHGYQLKVDYERLTRNGPINIGQIYQTLQRLERDGLVERGAGEPSDRRIPYQVTAAGRAAGRELLFDATEPSPAGRSSVAAKVLLATTFPGVDAFEVLDVQRAALVHTVQQARRRARAQDLASLDRLALEAELAVIEAELRWLDLCEDELKGGS